MTEVIAPDSAGIERAARLLQTGRLVAFPTETVYGLGACAFDATAVARVFEAKRRPEFDPLIVHIAHASDVGRVANEASTGPLARKLMDAFWPGALTIVLDKTQAVPGIVTSGLDTVAVRVPSHPVAFELISQAGIPIAAPSANQFGFLSPTRAEHVVTGLGDAVDLVIDGGATTYGVESTVVDARNDSVEILRLGAITVEEIEAVVGSVDIRTHSPSSDAAASPGTLDQHYSPETQLTLINEGDPLPARGENTAYVAFSQTPSAQFAEVVVLSHDANLREAAARLFEVLHRLDASDVTHIVAERVPNHGLGRAINDRLTRAAARWA